MKKTTYERREQKNIEKFFVSRSKAKEKKTFNPHEWLFCKAKDGYYYGDRQHFYLAKIEDIQEELKKEENSVYTGAIEYIERNEFQNYVSANIEEGENVYCDKTIKIIRFYNEGKETYIQKRYFKELPEGIAYFINEKNPGRQPVLAVDTDTYDIVGYILPIMPFNYRAI